MLWEAVENCAKQLEWMRILDFKLTVEEYHACWVIQAPTFLNVQIRITLSDWSLIPGMVFENSADKCYSIEV